jgi:glycosyltransferase involved in cell wall biosynthesis
MSAVNSQPIDVSVIVPVYNGGTFLPRCLGAISASDFPGYEVIVVDDGSTDQSVEISKSFKTNVLSSGRVQSGPAAARNVGSKHARGKILLFVDADVVIEPETISKVFARFDDPSVSAVFGSYDSEPAEQNFLSQYKNLQHRFVHQTSNPEASTFWAGLGAIRTGVFEAIGGFDVEQFAVPSIEDIELGVRLRQTGHRIILDRDIQAKHLKKWTPIQLLRTEIFCRAMPWSKLILTRQGVVNDMNLKVSDRISAALTLLSIGILPLLFWWPFLVIVPLACLVTVFLLNYDFFRFFARLKGPIFAMMTFPWLLAYFTYSSLSFAFCFLRFVPANLLSGRQVSR